MTYRDSSLIFAMHSFARLAHVDSVPNGVACGCHCPDCGEPLMAVQGEQIAHHFRHIANSDCVSGYETMAHILAKQIIGDAGHLRVPSLLVEFPDHEHTFIKDQIVELSDVAIEPWRKGVRPDAMATWEDMRFGIEIFVTNKCDRRKTDGYKKQKLAALEIDLSEFRDDLDPVAFRDAVLFGARRTWLFHPWQLEPARQIERQILESNANIAKLHADSRGDPVGQALVEEWFRRFWADA